MEKPGGPQPTGSRAAALTAGSLRVASSCAHCGQLKGREQLRSLRAAYAEQPVDGGAWRPQPTGSRAAALTAAAERRARVVTVAHRVRPLPSAGWLPVRALRCDILPYVDAEFCQMLISISTEMNLCF